MGIVDGEQQRAFELAQTMDDVLRVQSDLIKAQQKMIEHLQHELQIYRDMVEIS
jgi:hypothetical protein